jgi:hypothetical protein
MGKLKIYAEARLGNVTDELETLCNKIKPFAVIMGNKRCNGCGKNIFRKQYINDNTAPDMAGNLCTAG